MSEASLTRLIGAPPGSPGHAAGGELVNAALARPFSVFLFDEIEKAHPRILDLFLQILDEGRLTDSRGETAYFSEAMLVFTSNIGIIGGHQETNMGLRVLPSDSHEALTSKIVKGIQDHFRFKLQRPELMGRLGKNIIVFDFISGRSAPKIFDAIIERVLAAAKAEHGVDVDLTDEARLRLAEVCTSDLFEGGRGIANRIEMHFINPLARILLTDGDKDSITVAGLQTDKDESRLEILADPSL